MKSKISRVIIAAVLIFTMIPGVAVLAAEDDSGIMPRDEGILSSKPHLTISDSGLANCYAQVRVSPGYTADIELTLMRRAPSSSSWSEVMSWTDDTTPYSIDKYQLVTKGYIYQLKLDVNVYNSDGVLVSDPIKHSDEVEY
ncbi:MAG: hypothetical protein ACOX81_00770 [Candidatus Heteroscillospira sp.]|jgi:hypothetical protein